MSRRELVEGMRDIQRVACRRLDVDVVGALEDVGRVAGAVASRGTCTAAELRACVVHVGRVRRETERAVRLAEELESALEELLSPLTESEDPPER